MKAFSDYQNIIEKALNRNEIQKGLSDTRAYVGLSGPPSSGKYTFSDYVSNREKLSLSTDLVAVANGMDVIPFTNQTIGHHPHFSHLRGTTDANINYSFLIL